MEMPMMVGSTYSSSSLSLHDPPDILEAVAASVMPQQRRIQQTFAKTPEPQGKNIMAAARRLVKIVIVDPHPSVPLKDCVLYNGDEFITDGTDQELFYDIDIKKLIDTHNEKRTKIADKAIKERQEFLEPARVRDLKMSVVTVATF